jgi:hypothetical protein
MSFFFSLQNSFDLFKSNLNSLEICIIFFKLRKCVKPLQIFDFKWVLWNKNIKPNNFIYILLNDGQAFLIKD